MHRNTEEGYLAGCSFSVYDDLTQFTVFLFYSHVQSNEKMVIFQESIVR